MRVAVTSEVSRVAVSREQCAKADGVKCIGTTTTSSDVDGTDILTFQLVFLVTFQFTGLLDY
jgi:hypothetical protein